MIKTFLTLLSLTAFIWADSIKTNTDLTLTIKGVPAQDSSDFNGVYSVYKSGTINLPFLGAVSAAGKTPNALARQIESLYKNADIYTNPTVNIKYDVDNTLDQKTFTFRSQQGSKIIPYQRDLTLQEAIASAGGAGTFDSKRRVILERNQKEYEYDMTNIKHRNVKIYPKDVIKLLHVNKDGLFKGIFGN